MNESVDALVTSLLEGSAHTIEAYGVKGMKNASWRRTFKNHDALNKWVEKNDAEAREVSYLKKDES